MSKLGFCIESCFERVGAVPQSQEPQLLEQQNHAPHSCLLQKQPNRTEIAALKMRSNQIKLHNNDHNPKRHRNSQLLATQQNCMTPISLTPVQCASVLPPPPQGSLFQHPSLLVPDTPTDGWQPPLTRLALASLLATAATTAAAPPGCWRRLLKPAPAPDTPVTMLLLATALAAMLYELPTAAFQVLLASLLLLLPQASLP